MKNRSQPALESAGVARAARAALGFRAHSGWAALVAMAGPPGAPSVVDRRRIELADPAIPRPVQPYHAAQKLKLPEAEAYVQRFAREAEHLAGVALREATERLTGAGFECAGCGIPLGSGRPVPTVEAALASHPMLHTAEGELFRSALIKASENCGLQVLGIRERDLMARGAEGLGISLDALPLRLAELGRAAGPPWGQDQKLAALAAWLVLGKA